MLQKTQKQWMLHGGDTYFFVFVARVLQEDILVLYRFIIYPLNE